MLDRLTASGTLTDDLWRRAMHVSGSHDTGRWLDLVYQDETLVTRLDRHVTSTR